MLRVAATDNSSLFLRVLFKTSLFFEVLFRLFMSASITV
jgi:hypothetical protein